MSHWNSRGGAAEPSSMGRFGEILRNRLAAALVVLGLALSGFAHRPAAQPLPEPQIAAYLALGGSLHDLCLTDDPGGHGEHEGMLSDCPACTLCKGMALAGAQAGPSAPVGCGKTRAIWPALAVPIGPVPHLPEARAPPVAAVI